MNPLEFTKSQLRQFIRDTRRSTLSRVAASAAEKYLRAWYNEDFYDFESNGEAFVLDRFAAWWGNRPATVWDVGAHLGEWASEAHSRLPSAHIVSFEIVEPVYQRLAARFDGFDWSTPVCLGMSDVTGQAIVEWNQKEDTMSSIRSRTGHRHFPEITSKLSCNTIRGDDYISNNNRPDFIKIDVEGHELQVIIGCKDIISSDNGPSLIQFEYGDTYIPYGNTLKMVYDILGREGYSIGRIYPNHVDFRIYTYSEDHFRMGNYVGVRSSELQRSLS